MGFAQRRRELKSENKGKDQDVDAGGNAARKGGRDACGGRGAHFWVVPHKCTKNPKGEFLKKKNYQNACDERLSAPTVLVVGALQKALEPVSPDPAIASHR